MARGDDIEERLIEFAVQLIAVCEKLPETRAGRHVAGQLVRSGTAPAPHYGEARGAESRRDFVHKLRICLKELNESRIWLEIAKRSGMATALQLEPVLAECDELCRIVSASIQTTSGRKPS
jgi:four helix bundle protein